MQKTILIGNLGNDPELRNTQAGTAVCSFSVATTERWKDQQGKPQEKTEWHKIVVWGALANFCSEYLKKGTKVYIEGKNRTRSWTDQNGVERFITEIQAREMEILSPMNGNGGNSSNTNNSGNTGNNSSNPGSNNKRSNNTQNNSGYEAPPFPSGQSTGEDVPF